METEQGLKDQEAQHGYEEPAPDWPREAAVTGGILFLEKTISGVSKSTFEIGSGERLQGVLFSRTVRGNQPFTQPVDPGFKVRISRAGGLVVGVHPGPNLISRGKRGSLTGYREKTGPHSATAFVQAALQRYQMQGGLLKVRPCITRQGGEKDNLPRFNNTPGEEGFAVDPIRQRGIIAADAASLDGSNSIDRQRGPVRGIAECSISSFPFPDDEILVAGGLTYLCP